MRAAGHTVKRERRPERLGPADFFYAQACLRRRALRRNPHKVRAGRARARGAERDEFGRFLSRKKGRFKKKLMATVLISFGGSILAGIISSLLTIYLAPRARHEFWSRERITELRLATYDKVNGVTAAIYMYERGSFIPGRDNATLFHELLTSLMTIRADVRNRFSDKASTAYKDLESLVDSMGILPTKQVAYSEARNELLKQLHSESLK